MFFIGPLKGALTPFKKTSTWYQMVPWRIKMLGIHITNDKIAMIKINLNLWLQNRKTL